MRGAADRDVTLLSLGHLAPPRRLPRPPSRSSDTFRVILQMSLVLTYVGQKPVVKIGRMAGQFAKPRSSPTETIDGVTLPSYQGDNINRESPFSKEAREADPDRMVEAYDQCTQTLNILRAFSSGGYASLTRLHQWTLEFVKATPEGSRYAPWPRRWRRVSSS